MFAKIKKIVESRQKYQHCWLCILEKKKKWNSWPKYIKFATTILCSSRAHVPDSRLIFLFLLLFFFWIIREKVTIKYAYLAGHGLFRDTKAIYLNNCLTFSQSIKDFPQQVQQWEGKPTSEKCHVMNVRLRINCGSS